MQRIYTIIVSTQIVHCNFCYQNSSWSKKIPKRWIIKHLVRIIPFTGTRFFIGRILRSINAFLNNYTFQMIKLIYYR